MALVAAAALASSGRSPGGAGAVSLALEDVDVVLDGAADRRATSTSRSRTGETAGAPRAERLGQVDDPPRRSGPAAAEPRASAPRRARRDRRARRTGAASASSSRTPCSSRTATSAGNVGFGLRVAGCRRRSGAPRARGARARRARGRWSVAPVGDALRRRGAAGRARPRARARDPRVLLLDEPLGSLDGPLRDRLQDDLRDALRARSASRSIHVTHDVGEAFALGRPRGGAPRRPRRAGRDTRRALGAPGRRLGGTLPRHAERRVDGRRRATVIRPEAVRARPGRRAPSSSRPSATAPSCCSRVRRDDGVELEALDDRGRPSPARRPGPRRGRPGRHRPRARVRPERGDR